VTRQLEEVMVGTVWRLYSALSSESPNQCSDTYLFTIFSNVLLKRPLVTQCVTSAILFASGDIIAQQAIEQKQEKHDVRVTTTPCPFSPHLFSI